MPNQTALESKTRRKIIAMSIATVSLILLLIVAIVIVAIDKQTSQESGPFKLTGENNSQETPQSSPDSTTKDQTSTEPNTPAESSTLPTLDPTTPQTETPTAHDLPQTGPEDFFPLALLAGALVAYLTSNHLAKNPTTNQNMI